MKKRLYNDDQRESYTLESQKILQQFTALVQPLVVELAKSGYSIRDVHSVLESELACICLDVLLRPQPKPEDKKDESDADQHREDG